MKLSPEEKLAQLAETIANHAKAEASREWDQEFKEQLLEIMQACGLVESGHPIGSLEFKCGNVPSEEILFVLRNCFTERRAKLLSSAITKRLLDKAYKEHLAEESD